MKTQRLSRVLQNMAARGLDQILVTQTESIYYLTGLWLLPGERMLALAIDKSGDSKLFVNRMFAVPQLDGAALVEFDDVDDPVKVLAG
ncbi:MAG: aminopeptidase P family N-terminal domain-containing protein, partial [Clostridia bacterium]